jgi:hypothetical protein
MLFVAKASEGAGKHFLMNYDMSKKPKKGHRTKVKFFFTKNKKSGLEFQTSFR